MERTTGGPPLVLGITLVLVGLIYLALEYVPRRFLQIDIAHYGWPLFVIVPGLVLVGVGMTVQGLSGLCIPGAIVTAVGLVLLLQNIFDLFATWTYAWALVAPGGIGLGMWLQGVVSGSSGLRAAGWRTMGAGVIIFLLGAVLFEGVIHVSGQDFGFIGKVLLPVLLIVLGIWLLVRRTTSRGESLASR
jgi:hypothetical protein